MSDSSDRSSQILAAVHGYRNRGWRPIQLHGLGPDGKTCHCNRGANCTSKGKHPVDNEWQKAEAYSAADIEALWQHRPKGNVGIATGADSGVFVIDLDPKDDGVESFKALVAERGGEFPSTYCVQTGSGGYHYYLAMPADFDVRNSQSKLGPGIDVRGTGGQVVAPPSRTDKGDYVVLRDVEPAPAPAWLLELLRPAAPVDIITAEDLPKPEDISEAEWDRLNAYTQKAVKANLDRLDKLAADGWNGEPWDATTFQVSCSLVELANSPWNAYSLGQAEADVLAHAPRDEEGFDDYKVKQKFRSAREKVGDKARSIPDGPRADEPDPLFVGPDVRHRDDPIEGAAPERPRGPAPEDFFGEQGGLMAVNLARAVAEVGPIGFGADRDFWRYDDGLWVSDRTVVEDRCIELLRNKFRPGHVGTVSPIVRYNAVKLEGEPHPQYMNFRNGMLDWQTDDVLEHDPSFKSVVQFPINYDPEATCPTFDRFLGEVMHEDYVALAWEMIGYLLYSGNPLQVAFLLYGTGGNGKGTLTRVIQDMLGMHNIANEPLDRLNNDRFSAVNLYGKIANIAGDIDATYQESTAAFKRLTGEDEIAAERKFGDRFVFQNWAVPLFSANKIPGSSDVTEGYLRRWVVLHFHKRITDPIPGLSTLLATEVEGVAAKGIRALRTLMERGRFDPRGEATKGKQEFAQAIDQVRQWIVSGEIAHAPDTHESLTKLFAEYTIWAERTRRGRLSELEFSNRLEAIGYPRSVLAGVPGHTGLKAIDKHMSHSSFTF